LEYKDLQLFGFAENLAVEFGAAALEEFTAELGGMNTSENDLVQFALVGGDDLATGVDDKATPGMNESEPDAIFVSADTHHDVVDFAVGAPSGHEDELSAFEGENAGGFGHLPVIADEGAPAAEGRGDNWERISLCIEGLIVGSVALGVVGGQISGGRKDGDGIEHGVAAAFGETDGEIDVEFTRQGGDAFEQGAVDGLTDGEELLPIEAGRALLVADISLEKAFGSDDNLSAL